MTEYDVNTIDSYFNKNERVCLIKGSEYKFILNSYDNIKNDRLLQWEPVTKSAFLNIVAKIENVNIGDLNYITLYIQHFSADTHNNVIKISIATSNFNNYNITNNNSIRSATIDHIKEHGSIDITDKYWHVDYINKKRLASFYLFTIRKKNRRLLIYDENRILKVAKSKKVKEIKSLKIWDINRLIYDLQDIVFKQTEMKFDIYLGNTKNKRIKVLNDLICALDRIKGTRFRTIKSYKYFKKNLSKSIVFEQKKKIPDTQLIENLLKLNNIM